MLASDKRLHNNLNVRAAIRQKAGRSKTDIAVFIRQAIITNLALQRRNGTNPRGDANSRISTGRRKYYAARRSVQSPGHVPVNKLLAGGQATGR